MKFIREPRIDRKTGLPSGKTRLIFTRYNQEKGRTEKVLHSAIPKHILHCEDDAKVLEWCNSEAAKVAAKSARIQERLAWKGEFHDFNRLLEEFTESQKIKAKNSWKTDVHYLEHYVFHYFLSVSRSNKVAEWHYLAEDFKIWLSKTKPYNGQKESLALNTQNRAINAFNKFMKLMKRKGKIDFPVHLEVHKESQADLVTVEDLYTDDEINKVYDDLSQHRQSSANLFYILAKTGMRENEGLGLCLKFIYPEKIGGGTRLDEMQRLLKDYGLDKYEGYLLLESQPELSSIREKDSVEVPRSPLKHRPVIDSRYSRIIPIWDSKAWEIIRELYNKSLDDLETKRFGLDEGNYLFFDGLTASMFYNDLKKSCDRLGLRFRSPHCLRHTFLTDFYGKTNENLTLAERVAGHSTLKMVRRYSHVREQLGLEIQRKARGRKKI
jgi:integrase